MTKITIIGAGIIGLYTAYLLLEQGYSPKDITIIAKHTPGDLSHDYASPYAGATVNAVKSTDKKVQSYYKYTFNKLGELRNHFTPSGCGIDYTLNYESWSHPPSENALNFFKSYNKDWKELRKDEMPEGANFGLKYRTWVINSPLLIKSLFEYIKRQGISVIIKELGNIQDVKDDIVFNCTGLGSKILGRVEDSKCHPTRAQVVVIRAPYLEGVRLHWSDTANYMIKRPFSNDEVILGGFYQPENYNKDVNGYESKDILERVTKCFPILKPGTTIQDLDILREVSAFRPGRKGGVRIEKEIIDGRIIIHNYGAEGDGYAQGLGMAKHAIELITHGSKL